MAGTLDSRAAFTAMVGVSIDTLGFWYRLLGSRSWYDFSGGGRFNSHPWFLCRLILSREDSYGGRIHGEHHQRH